MTRLYEDLALNGLYGLLLRSCLRNNRLGCISMYSRDQGTVVYVIELYSVYTAIYADKTSLPAHDVVPYMLDHSNLESRTRLSCVTLMRLFGNLSVSYLCLVIYDTFAHTIPC